MMETGKKENYRFSLRMNPEDPIQKAAAEILNTKGRRISDYVARAVMALAKQEQLDYNLPESEISEDTKTKSNTSAPPTAQQKTPCAPQSNSMESMLDGLGALKP